MKLFILFSIVSAVLSAPFYNDANDYELLKDQDLEDTTDIYDDHDYGTDSEFVDYDSDNSDLDLLGDEDGLEIEGVPVFVDLSPCGSNSILSISSLEFNPDPPKTGQNLTLIASGVLSAPIEEGAQLRVTVKLGFVPLYDKTDNLCDIARNNGLQCPIGVGKHSIIAGFPVPAVAPKKTYKLLISAKNPDGHEILCLNGNLQLT